MSKRIGTNIKQIPVPKATIRAIRETGGKNIKGYQIDDCKIILSKDYGAWHLSLSHPYRYPTSIEIEEVKEFLLPNIQMEIKFVSQVSYCVHLFEIENSVVN